MLAALFGAAEAKKSQNPPLSLTWRKHVVKPPGQIKTQSYNFTFSKNRSVLSPLSLIFSIRSKALTNPRTPFAISCFHCFANTLFQIVFIFEDYIPDGSYCIYLVRYLPNEVG
jgi:hypothetical protein